MTIRLQDLPRYVLTAIKRVRQHLHPYAHGFKAVLKRSPCTLQTGLLILFCSYLLLGPVPGSSDIVSASLALGLITTLALIGITTLIHGLRIKKRLRVELFPPDEPIHAQKQTRCVLHLSAFKLLPGTFLDCSLAFTHSGQTASTVRLYGAVNDDRRVALPIMFPHRGNWDITGINCVLGDSSGCVRLSWQIPIQSSIVVAPTIPHNTSLPLVSSTQRPGDLVPDAVHRYGDPFDIKPYHPSDGIKKIVWKAFAKSGELLTRHPEPSMTPEGFVAICVLARPEDDDLCGKAVSYIAALKELTLDILVGCQGYNGRPLGNDEDTSRTLLIDSTWDAAHSSTDSLQADVQALIDACASSNSQIQLRKLVVFCDGSRISNPVEMGCIVQLANWLDTSGIEPVFFLTQPESVAIHKQPSNLLRKTRAIFVEPDSSAPDAISASNFQSFLSTCLSKQWEVFV